MTLEDVARAARLQQALDLAWGRLARRECTVLELRRLLEAGRVEPATIQEALATLRRQGYLDDERYARRLAEDKRRLEGWGADRIARRLAAAGVDPDLIALAVDRDRRTELAQALSVLRRRYADPPADPAEMRRAFALLQRKGYDAELAGDALRVYARDAA